MSLMYLSLAFIIGFLLGGGICWLGITKFFPKHQLQDELTRSKRELASARRAIDEFFKSSDDLFAQLDKSHRHFARYMNEASRKLAPSIGALFEVEEQGQIYSKSGIGLPRATLLRSSDAAPAAAPPADPVIRAEPAAPARAARASEPPAAEAEPEEHQSDPEPLEVPHTGEPHTVAPELAETGNIQQAAAQQSEKKPEVKEVKAEKKDATPEPAAPEAEPAPAPAPEPAAVKTPPKTAEAPAPLDPRVDPDEPVPANRPVDKTLSPEKKEPIKI